MTFVSPLVAPSTPIGALVADRPSRARVFERHRLDYCCGGSLALEAACHRRGADLAVVVEELLAHDAEAAGAPDAEDWRAASPALLIDHIVAAHHAYLRREFQRLDQLTAKVASVHGHDFPVVMDIQRVYQLLRAELIPHMFKEENILFPWIATLESEGTRPGSPVWGIQHPIRAMEHEHEEAGRALEQLHDLTEGYVPPDHACNTWRVLYDTLGQLERDTHLHIHKENNVLHPAALRLAGVS